MDNENDSLGGEKRESAREEKKGVRWAGRWAVCIVFRDSVYS